MWEWAGRCPKLGQKREDKEKDKKEVSDEGHATSSEFVRCQLAAQNGVLMATTDWSHFRQDCLRLFDFRALFPETAKRRKENRHPIRSGRPAALCRKHAQTTGIICLRNMKLLVGQSLPLIGLEHHEVWWFWNDHAEDWKCLLKPDDGLVKGHGVIGAPSGVVFHRS